MDSLIHILASADARLMYLLNVSLRNPVFDLIMPVFDYDAAWRTPLILAWLAVMIFGKKRERLVCLGAMALLLLTDPVSSRLIKPLAARIRPCNVLPGLYMWHGGAWLILPDPVIEIYRGSYSMPSSHAVNTGAQALWWSWAYPRLRGVWLGLAAVIGFSRIYDGVHWPGDVLAGWAVAAGLFLIVRWTWITYVLKRVRDSKREGFQAS